MRTEGHVTHDTRSVTMKLREPIRGCPQAVSRHFQNQMLFQWVSIHAGLSHMIKYDESTVVSFQSAVVSWFCGRPMFEYTCFLKRIQVTMKHDTFDLI